MCMDWKITYPKVWNKETRSYVDGDIEERFGEDAASELLELIEDAFNQGLEITVEINQWDPTDYIAARDSEGVTTAADLLSAAWDQHVAMHS